MPERWARDHLWLLNAVFAAFDRDGDWPPIERVQRTLADADTSRAVAVAQLAIDIPSELGARQGDRLTLTTRALSYCSEAAPLLTAFVGAIQQAVEVYRASDTEHPPVLSGFAVKTRLQLDESTYIKVSRLLYQEPWFFGNGGGNVDEDWHHNVRVEVLLAEHIRDIADYLDCVAQYRFGEPYVIENNASNAKRAVKLEHDWDIGDQIGIGGFGRVMLAYCGDKQAVAKFVPKEPGAGRELLFVDLHSARNVVPVIDHGETQDSWVLVMPHAEMSLRQHLDEVDSALPPEEVRAILTDVATTLVDLVGNVVHRDIKPENVLLLEGRWCLADFGISRYAEATTAPDTHKFAMSPPYAAPERWRGERATAAADVYAVGVMGYEMLTGTLPFQGPSVEDFRDQHLHSDPLPIEGINAGLASLVEACLIKAPGARPEPASLLSQLGRVVPSALSGLTRLQEASRSHAGQIAVAARHASEANTEEQRRRDLFNAASKSERTMMDTMADVIKAAAPASTSGSGRASDHLAIRLGSAELRVLQSMQCGAQPGDQRISFDVVACSDVELSMPQDAYGYEGRSHALWFCDAQEVGVYSWFETAFMIQPLMARQANRDPFSLRPQATEAREAIGPSVGAFQVARPFIRLGDTTLEAFIGRWANWFADAVEGRLYRPDLPEMTPEGSWRRT